MGLSTTTAARYVERWELQQQRYAIGREERFTVIADVVEHVTVGQDSPLVVDLGCGPGSLAARLATRLPGVELVAVDMDPLLLELARGCHPSAARYVETVIGEEGWVAALGLDRGLDAAVSTTALHYLDESTLRAVYQQIAGMLRPGGILLNADHLHPETTEPAALVAHIGRRRAEQQRAFVHEDWGTWWAAVAEDPEFSDLLTERRCRLERQSSSNNHALPLSVHRRLLRDAGFIHAGPVWQVGNSYVLAAVR